MWKAFALALLVLLGLTACQAAQASGSGVRAEPASSQSMPATGVGTGQSMGSPAFQETPGANQDQGVGKDKAKGAKETGTDEAEDETEDEGTQGATVGVCHKTGSETNPYVFIKVSESAVPAHEAHGDRVKVTADACPKAADESEDESTTRVGVCHRTGSENNPYVYIQVSESAVSAHEAHGDIVKVTSADACPKTAPDVGAPGAHGKPDKDKDKGKPDDPGSQGNGNSNGNGNGQNKDKDKGTEKDD